MSKQVIRLMEEHYKNIQLQKLRLQLEQRNRNLEKFAGVVSHDLKSPLAQIKALSELLEQDMEADLNADSRQYLEYIKDSSDSLRGYIDGILRFYKTDKDLEKKKDWIDATEFINEIQGMFKGDKKATFNTLVSVEKLHVNKAALTQVFVNLISNAIKYNDKNRQIINISISGTDEAYHFAIADNGPGIPEESASEIFELFSKLHEMDRYGKEGSGIGLATVKKVIETLGGEIRLTSELGEGSTFEFYIPK
jgi:signal transduction histidine kinase